MQGSKFLNTMTNINISKINTLNTTKYDIPLWGSKTNPSDSPTQKEKKRKERKERE